MWFQGMFSWLYSEPTGDLGRDRNARTLQSACLLLSAAVGTLVILNLISHEQPITNTILLVSMGSLFIAAFANRMGETNWAARILFVAVLLTACVLVIMAHDGFRSHAMLVFPGLLLISVMLMDRVSYFATAGIVLFVVAGLGVAERSGSTYAIPRVRSPTTYDSIFSVDLILFVIALIGSRIVRDVQSNVIDLHNAISRASQANVELGETAEALRESEQQLVSVYNTVRDVIFHLAVEPEGRFRFVSVNAAFLRVTGLSREMVVGRTVNDVVPEPSLAMVLAKYRKAIDENTIVSWEETSDYPTGRLTGEVSVVPVFDTKGICTHLVGSVHDITERKRAEAALRESEARLKNAERLAHVGNWRLDLKNNELSWSEEMFRIFGWEQNYMPCLDGVLRAVMPEDRRRVERAVTDCLAAKDGFSVEFQATRPNGDLRTINCYGEVRVDEEGRPVHLLGACHDLTELRRAQKEDFARQKLETVGTLANGIAHDFNNLLGGVLAESELGLMEIEAGVDPKEELRAIRDVAFRGSEIVRQLMVYAGKETAAMGPVDVSQIVKEMLQLLKVSVSKHAKLETDLDEDLPIVQADPAQVRQIVMNLVTNASEAIGDRDGVIRVTTRYIKLGPDQSRGDLHPGDNDYVQLEVSDTGCGIPPETQAKVFDPFFSTKCTGHGLGLAIVDGIVRSLRGQIKLVSELGRGTALQVLLPCHGRVTKAISDPMSHEVAARVSKRATVLVVEDEEMLRQVAAKALRNSGFEVLVAANGSAAVDVLRTRGRGIDVILLDMTIPGASSHEVAAEYAQTRPDAKVILTSAYGEEMARATISLPQIRGFIRKPFQLRDLVETLRNSL